MSSSQKPKVQIVHVESSDNQQDHHRLKNILINLYHNDPFLFYRFAAV